MTTKRVDLSVLPDDFLVEFNNLVNGKWSIIKASQMKSFSSLSHRFRPMLDQPQVLDDYSWLPDGIVLECRTGYGDNPIWSSEEVKLNTKYGYIQWIKPIGLHPDYAEQAKEWGYPVVEL